MTTLKSQEGYLIIDQRASDDPIPENILREAGLPTSIPVKMVETPTYTCKHCQAVVVKEIKRTRPRAFCKGCNHLICDNCAVIKEILGRCVTFDQIADQVMNAAEKKVSTEAPSILLLPD